MYRVIRPFYFLRFYQVGQIVDELDFHVLTRALEIGLLDLASNPEPKNYDLTLKIEDICLWFAENPIMSETDAL
jgi:ribosomal protein S3AE